MDIADEKVIELSKGKLLLLVVAAGVFVVLGWWMFSTDTATIAASRRNDNPFPVHGLGLIAMVFFGIRGVAACKKSFDAKPGLVLNRAGILDNSSGRSARLISWADIAGFDKYEIRGRKLLVVKLSDPEKHIEVGGAMKRFLNRTNYKMCGSPILISTSALAIGFQELQDTCNQYLSRYGGPGIQ